MPGTIRASIWWKPGTASPSEVARLLGLPEAFRFPEALSLEARYRLLGNSLSIPVAAWALDHL